ncbi:YbcC family protein [Paracidovorax oryzae]|uniref:YbcC family protein n=1 Tax=Paracidovorax oryzae TaxID=862720 RepID=UPI0002D76F24|nr:DUF2309 domain-containing protein [Paracidovorax oryzae]
MHTDTLEHDALARAAAPTRIQAACAQACSAIAPAWPLDRAIAVNPHWQRTGQPLRRVAARMALLGGIQVFPPRERQREAWYGGRISPEDLALALQQLPDALGLSADDCIAALDRSDGLQPLPLLIDVLDNDPARDARLTWRQAITHQVSQTCAAFFDRAQADWQPERGPGLYAFWRDTLTHDHGIGTLMGLPGLHRGLQALPATREDAEAWAMHHLQLPDGAWADYLEAVLLTVNGWASWCAYLAWQAPEGAPEREHLRDLLAIRLAWGAVLLECKDDAAARQAFAALQAEWRRAPERLRQAGQALVVDEAWQLALELGFQRELAGRLARAPGFRPAEPEAQAVFCIDVRSEPLRRALEATAPTLQTLGFAGFFGVPAAYTPLGTTARRPQLPGLLPPAMEVTDQLPDPGAAVTARQRRLAWAAQWESTTRWPGAAFSFVEALGAGYLGKLGGWLWPREHVRDSGDQEGLPARYRPVCRPMLSGLPLQERAALAARVLKALGLARGAAPLVMLVGHGSQSANNAQAAALDCGACCGQTGEVNARALALLLNDAEVRGALPALGIALPESTCFVAALHNTTTDEIEGFDLDLLPPEARARWERWQPVFTTAGDRVRRERAPSLGLDPHAAAGDLLSALRRRANDGAQTRPEWGLAGNAAFVIAPRSRTWGAELGGRAFLHDYDPVQDADGSLLELLMTAPMLVTHWINWQYHASTCDPGRLGSGNKLLHNVVGGHIGVFEGNGGDLRIGLSRQSLHDGQRWVHEPLRLTVVIDAPAEAIDAVIARHAVLQQLLGNGWLHLWRFAAAGLERREAGGWFAVGTGPSGA